MSDTSPEAAAAGGMVRARLGRPPQDLLEAVVVLEAWGGVPTVGAFGVGSAVIAPDAAPAAPARAPLRRRRTASRESVVAESVALLVAILAIAAWAGPLSRELGAGGARACARARAAADARAAMDCCAAAT